MSTTHDPASVSRHYDTEDLTGRLLAALRLAGKDLDRLVPDDLTLLDQFHTGGKSATLEMIRLANLPRGARVLDVGGGIGGPARTLATEIDAQVTVLDLSASFCEAGKVLTDLTGLSGKVAFEHGDALDLPFGDGSFDALWTQHSSMNIADKERLYAEIHRVLRPRGRLALHEVMAGSRSPVLFPVPWASGPEISFLRTPDGVRALIGETGFQEVVWIDQTASAIDAWRKRLAAPPADPTALGTHLLSWPDWQTRSKNMLQSYEEDRIVLNVGVFDRG
jgi:SAM-dependent methyltransferase